MGTGTWHVQVPVSQPNPHGGSWIQPVSMLSSPVVECTWRGACRPARLMTPASMSWVRSLKFVSARNGALRGCARRYASTLLFSVDTISVSPPARSASNDRRASTKRQIAEKALPSSVFASSDDPQQPSPSAADASTGCRRRAPDRSPNAGRSASRARRPCRSTGCRRMRTPRRTSTPAGARQA